MGWRLVIEGFIEKNARVYGRSLLAIPEDVGIDTLSLCETLVATWSQYQY